MDKKTSFKPVKASQTRCLSFLTIILCMYLFENLSFISISRTSLYIYIIKPIIWCITIFIIWLFPRIRAKSKIRLRESLKWWSIFSAVIYVMCMFLVGIVVGYGKNPYNLSIFGIISNLFSLGTILVGRELVRAYIVNSTVDKHPVLSMGLFSLFVTLIDMPISRVSDLKTGLEITQYIGESFLPDLTNSIMATYLVYTGGPLLSIIYLGIIQGFFWFCPILPNLKWIVKTLIGTLCPIFSLMSVKYMYAQSMRSSKNSQEKKESPVGWIITSIVSISIVWFSVGVFPLKPSVIATGSMKPMIQPGDMVLVEKYDKIEDIKVGDVIHFKRDNIYIFHRIINFVKDEEEQTMYQTKGDNNSGPDSELVKPEDIKGKVVKVIPKVGWPTLLLKSRNSVPKGEVEF